MVPDIIASSMQFSSFLAGNTGVGVGVEGSTVVLKETDAMLEVLCCF